MKSNITQLADMGLFKYDFGSLDFLNPQMTRSFFDIYRGSEIIDLEPPFAIFYTDLEYGS